MTLSFFQLITPPHHFDENDESPSAALPDSGTGTLNRREINGIVNGNNNHGGKNNNSSSSGGLNKSSLRSSWKFQEEIDCEELSREFVSHLENADDRIQSLFGKIRNAWKVA